MTASEYYDWWFFSGICPGIPTRPANYAVLREQLSAAGVDLIVLWELLADNDGFDETVYVAPTGIFGSNERIAGAARNVGAERLAQYLADTPGATVVPETHKEVKKLLKAFAAAHKPELAADIARHGDPRANPGFDKRKARRQRDEQCGENNGRYQIADQVPFFAEPLKQLTALLEQGLTLAEISRQSQDMAGFACCLQYDAPRWAESPQPPEVAQFLDQCRRLTQQYPAQMPAWGAARNAVLANSSPPAPPAAAMPADEGVLNQLRAIGSYTTERVGPRSMIIWKSVPALGEAIASMGLRFEYEGEFPPQLLSAWSDAQRRFSAAVPAMSVHLIALGREQRATDKTPDDEQILSEVTQGMLSLAANGWLECTWDVEWDPEHGCTFEIDEQGKTFRVN